MMVVVLKVMCVLIMVVAMVACDGGSIDSDVYIDNGGGDGDGGRW